MDYRYNEFENLGSKQLCQNEVSGQISAPHWLNKDKVRRAKALARKHLFGILFAHLSGLVLLVYIKSILISLLSTGNSRTVTQLFGRYFRTLMHIKSWYEGDVWDISDPAHKSIMQVSPITLHIHYTTFYYVIEISHNKSIFIKKLQEQHYLNTFYLFEDFHV